MGEHLAQGSCKRNDCLLRQLDDSEEGSHRVQILIIAEKFANVLEEFTKDVLGHISLVKDGLAGLVERLPHEELLDAGCCIRLVHCLFGPQVLTEKIDKFGDVLVRNLVSEHVDKLDAGRFEDHQVIKRDSLLQLELRHDELSDVLLEELGRDAHIRRTVLVSVAAYARRDDQVDYRRHLLPVGLLVLHVLSLHLMDKLANKRVHLLFEVAGKFLHKLHALATSRL